MEKSQNPKNDVKRALKTPQEVLYDLALWIPDTWRKLGPGQVILRLPNQVREQLKKLTSKDTNIRPDLIWPNSTNDE